MITPPQPASYQLKFKNSWWPGIVLLLLSMIIGLLCYKDYGISWDEPAQRGVGRATYAYVVNGDNFLKTYDDRGLGTGFELPLYFMEKWLHLEDSRDIFLARHLVTHLFFLLGVFCGYLLALRLFKNQFIACLAFLLIAFHPRIYAHSFFNSKDIPFLSAFLITLLLSQVAFEKNRAKWFLFLGIAGGYATSIRAMGIILVPIIGTFLLIDIFRSLAVKEKVIPGIRNALLFIIGFCGMLYISWPILWSNPVFYFTESFHNLANIVWTGTVLFDGKIYKGDQLPWNYMPAWFSITMPELLLVAGIGGITWVVIRFLKRPVKYLTNTPERNYLLYLACFSGPIIAMTIFHGVNIDDWRHIYFIYPSFVMLALFVVNKLLQGRRKIIVQAAYILQLLVTGIFVVKNYPYQQVYFNNFVSHDNEYLRNHYDMDYWGVAYKQGIDYILTHDTSSSIAIYTTYGPVMNNVMLLPAAAKKRIVFAGDNDRPDYFITNFRMHKNDYNYPRILYDIKVLNSTILRIYKLH